MDYRKRKSQRGSFIYKHILGDSCWDISEDNFHELNDQNISSNLLTGTNAHERAANPAGYKW